MVKKTPLCLRNRQHNASLRIYFLQPESVTLTNWFIKQKALDIQTFITG